MSSIDEMVRNMAAFHADLQASPGLTLDEWRKRVSWQKPAMGVDVRVSDLRKLIERCAELEQRVAMLDVCEACGDCLEPVPPRCERHVNTEPGDDEWTMDDEDDEAPEHRDPHDTSEPGQWKTHDEFGEFR